MKDVIVELSYAEQTAIGQWALVNSENCIIQDLWSRVKQQQDAAAKPRKYRKKAVKP